MVNDRLIWPFDDKSAQSAQVEWARRCGTTVHTTNCVGMQFVIIPPGEFMRGYSAENIREFESLNPTFTGVDDDDDYVQHQTILTRPMYVGTHKVTRSQYFLIAQKTPSSALTYVAREDIPNLPVDSVSWFDCVEACNLMSKLDGLESYYRFEGDIFRSTAEGPIRSAEITISGGNGYRLLTNAEWEFCCRAGKTSLFPYGIDPREYLNYPTCQIGEKQRVNSFGISELCDLYREWVFDATWFESYLEYVARPAIDPVDLYNDELERSTRGIDCCGRSSFPAATDSTRISFRMCRTLDDVTN